MIAKRIPSPKGGSGFRRLAAYVVNAKGNADPAAWTRLNAYILDSEHAGEKVAWARVSNCCTNDPGLAVKEILATQAKNRRAKADKSYHLVVSFPNGEKPTRAQIEDIEDTLCEAIGFGQHQRVSAVHQNTDNWHLHVAINRVEPGTFRAIHPYRDHYRLQEACIELEVKHGLTREVHSRDAAEAALNDQRKRAVRDPAQETGREAVPQLASTATPPKPRDATYAQYRHELARARAARDKELRELRVKQADYARQLYEWHSDRLRRERLLDQRGHLRSDGFAYLANQRRKDRADRLTREREERQCVLAAHPLPEWRDYQAAAQQQRAPSHQDRQRSAPSRNPRGQGAER